MPQAVSQEVLVSMFVGSSVDVDHFIAAQSFSLAAATHLTERPWGHSLISCASSSIFCYTILGFRWGLLVFSAYLVHLLRDSVRRGLMLWRLSSEPLPHSFVFIIYFLLPMLLKRLLHPREASVKSYEEV